MHDIGADKIHHIATRFIILVIVDGDHRIVLIPAEVLLPSQIVSVQTAVSLRSKVSMKLLKLLIIPLHTAHIARLLKLCRDLSVLYHICHLV